MQRRRQRGSALVATVWVMIALSAVVLVLARSMIVEALTSKQRISIAKAKAAEAGVEQYLLSLVASELVTPGYMDEIPFEQRELGDCYFWLIKPDLADATVRAFGINDEAAKIDLNTATYDQLLALSPYMTDEFASAIIDWRDTDDEITGLDGGEDEFYMSLPTPYHCKSAPFESIDELKLVKGCTPEILYGLDTNQNGVLDESELAAENSEIAADNYGRGIYPFITVHGVLATNPPANATPTTTDAQGNTLININSNAQTTAGYTGIQGVGSVLDWAFQLQGMNSTALADVWSQVTWQPAQAQGVAAQTTETKIAKVNLNTASETSLLALGLQEGEVASILSYRDTSYDPTTKDNVSWVLDLLAPETRAQRLDVGGNQYTIGAFLTGSSTVYSADIVTVSRDGRAFKRVKVIIDASSGTPMITFRRDLTSAGWPLDPAIREQLRSGTPLQSNTGNGMMPSR